MGDGLTLTPPGSSQFHVGKQIKTSESATVSENITRIPFMHDRVLERAAFLLLALVILIAFLFSWVVRHVPTRGIEEARLLALVLRFDMVRRLQRVETGFRIRRDEDHWLSRDVVVGIVEPFRFDQGLIILVLDWCRSR